MLPLLTAKQAAERLGICKDTFIWHVQQGEIQCISLGRGLKRVRRLYDPADLDAFVEARKSTIACPSTSRGARKRTSSTSSGEVS